MDHPEFNFLNTSSSSLYIYFINDSLSKWKLVTCINVLYKINKFTVPTSSAEQGFFTGSREFRIGSKFVSCFKNKY